MLLSSMYLNLYLTCGVNIFVLCLFLYVPYLNKKLINNESHKNLIQFTCDFFFPGTHTFTLFPFIRSGVVSMYFMTAVIASLNSISK